MDFYSAQDQARRYSRWLVLWFLLAVVVLIGITNVLIAALVYSLQYGNAYARGPDMYMALLESFSWETFGYVSLAVVATVFMVILFKWIQLSAGGKAVAERLGGERILPHTEDAAERRCLNVVEEMSLAAGLPVPPVYQLADEAGINAFAAGITPADAVIGVTRGTLERFNREQLQGVVAHEFSHILNGDMRLNIRLAALLKGITFIGDIGEVMVRGTGRRTRVGRGKSQLPAQAMFVGVSLWVIGWLGALFASFIKAAVSRQRELLADASAVQFTRNPGGVADALKVIGGHSAGSMLAQPRASELSHIFFGEISAFGGLARTHPPLPDRIRRIEPNWNGDFIYPPESAAVPEPAGDTADDSRRKQAAVAAAAIAAGTALGGAEAASSEPAAVLDISDPVSGIPDALSQQAHDPFGANAVLCALLLGASVEARERQFEVLEQSGIRGLAATTRQLHPQVAALDPRWRLSLLELSLPALKCMSAQQYKSIKETQLQLARADGQIDLYEWCLYQVVRHYLDPEFLQVQAGTPRFRKPGQLREQMCTVISVLAWHGHADEQQRAAAFTRAIESLGLYGLELKPLAESGVAEFSRAVNDLADAYPLLKPRLLKAMARCAAHDGELTPREVEILVAVAAVMDCPVPASVRQNPVIQD